MTEQSQPQQKAIPPLSDDQLNMVKSSLLESLHKAYRAFLDVLRRMPADQNCVRISFENLDTGLFWFEAGIRQMPTQNLHVVPVSPQQEAPSQPSEAKAPESSQEEIAVGEPHP